MSTPTLWTVTITETRVGPRGGRAAPVIRRYAVSASNRAEALAVFDDEVGAHQREGNCTVTVTDNQCRVAALN